MLLTWAEIPCPLVAFLLGRSADKQAVAAREGAVDYRVGGSHHVVAQLHRLRYLRASGEKEAGAYRGTEIGYARRGVQGRIWAYLNIAYHDSAVVGNAQRVVTCRCAYREP